MNNLELSHLKKLLVLFWTIYFTIAFASNVSSGLHALGILPAQWHFNSHNFELIKQVISSTYQLSTKFAAILFSGVIILELIIVILFWRATWYFCQDIHNTKVVKNAFCFSMILWGLFLISEEIFIAYGIEATHFRLLIAEMVSLLFIYLLPNHVTEVIE